MGSDLVGRNLGPYRIIEQLGLGGMATVYKAYQPNVDRYVAIKVLPRHFAADPSFIGRFEQEAKIIARLEHARILPVYDYGEDDGITYLVMRYLQAGTLADRLASGPIPLDEAARILSQVAEGLDHAHRSGVIHRDVKPSNIMLDSAGDAYITDFGISKLVEGSAQFTGSGIIGTPAYMSPEQGLGQPVDHRTDVYSLGVVLYQMVVGQVPFQAETPMAVVIKHIHEPLPLPSQVRPGLPAAVERVILRAMAKNPDARYQSCGELAAALRDAVESSRAGETSLAPPPGSTELDATLPLGAPAEAQPATPPPGALATPPGPITPPPPGPEKRRRLPWWAIAGIVLLAVALLCVGVVIFALRTGRIVGDGIARQIDENFPTLATEVAAGLTAEAAAPDEARAMPPDRLGECPPEAEKVFFETFENYRGELPPGAGLVNTGDRSYLVMTSEGDQQTMLYLPEPLLGDGIVRVLAGANELPAAIQVFSRLQPPQGGYAGQFGSEASGIVRIGADGFHIYLPDTPFPLEDDRTHVLELETKGGRITFRVDGELLHEWTDQQPLPPGGFAVVAERGVIRVGGLLACAYPGAAEQPRGEVVFADDFQGEGLAEAWKWIDEPPGWELVEGRLMLPVLPRSGDFSVREGLDLPGLMMTLPDAEIVSFEAHVDVQPTQNLQRAGLVLLTSAGRPVITFGRGFCDQEGCGGDALYLQTHSVLPRIPDELAVFEPGSLPDGPVRLMLAFKSTHLLAFYDLLDGRGWQPAAEREMPGLAEARPDLRAGLFTGTGGHDSREPIPAFFDEVIITVDALPAPGE
ncbi:MAG: hypothetical protein Kow00124_29950 [Anaerolineae bacterium]